MPCIAPVSWCTLRNNNDSAAYMDIKQHAHALPQRDKSVRKGSRAELIHYRFAQAHQHWVFYVHSGPRARLGCIACMHDESHDICIHLTPWAEAKVRDLRSRQDHGDSTTAPCWLQDGPAVSWRVCLSVFKGGGSLLFQVSFDIARIAPLRLALQQGARAMVYRLRKRHSRFHRGIGMLYHCIHFHYRLRQDVSC